MPTNQETSPSPRTEAGKTSLVKTISAVLIGVSAGLCVFVFVCYWNRFDWCAAVTIYPPWCWVVGGLTVALPGLRRCGRRTVFSLILLWLTFLGFFADSPSSFVRTFVAPPEDAGAIRVITFNCGTNGDSAAQEVISFNPDIVLFQESCSRAQLEEVARQLYGDDAGVLWSPDTSIIARGKLTPVHVEGKHRANFVHAKVRLLGSPEIDVICLRLLPCPVRIDFWAPDCWRTYQTNREERRAELQRIVDHLASTVGNAPVICGGDFNAPPNDAVFRLLKPSYRDTFPLAGRGWGKTIVNPTPVLRIDQIWTSRQWQPPNVRAHTSQESDHCMVICDMRLQARSASE